MNGEVSTSPVYNISLTQDEANWLKAYLKDQIIPVEDAITIINRPTLYQLLVKLGA